VDGNISLVKKKDEPVWVVVESNRGRINLLNNASISELVYVLFLFSEYMGAASSNVLIFFRIDIS